LGNDNLKNAMRRAALRPDDFADIIEVDPKTVQRWLAGRVPYPRHRGKIARALDTTEAELWPELTPAPASPTNRASSAAIGDLLAGYPRANSPEAPTPEALIAAATERIVLLDPAIEQLLNRPGIPELLVTKAADGCHVRILCSKPFPYVKPLLDQAGIEIRTLDLAEQPSIHRFDQHMLLIMRLRIDRQAESAPALIHLHRSTSGGLFDRLARHLDDAWEHNSEPLTPTHHSAAGDNKNATEEKEREFHRPSASKPPTAHAPDSATTPPRRWPRRAD
jgi:hypothetical protein